MSPFAETATPSTTLQPTGPPVFLSTHCDKSLPSNKTIASLGGVAFSLKVPGVTMGGCGRAGSWTCHLPSGCIGVS